jgi:phosphodiesterase/alkaline phosphatase D-like protein
VVPDLPTRLVCPQTVPWAAPGAWPDDPFTLGVASGDPTPTGTVLWTRLAPRPLDPDGGMPARAVPVDWEVATGPRFRDVVRRGRIAATPALAHAVHVEVDGLDPGRHYWYRFRAGGHLSRIGRTRTCPDPRRPLVRLDLAFVSCQNFEKGYYTAYRHLAEDDLDVVLHLGDYIYENPPRRNLPRRHVGGEPADLPGYRVRHALYKTDRDLQAAHARHPFVATWDDHEVENDYAGRHPVEGGDPAAFLRRRAAAYRVYWEHMPLRRPPRGPTMPLYRRLRFGDLVELNLLDTRQYRDNQPCDEDAGGGRVVTCPERVDPRRTILGSHQRRWLLDGLDRSQARWNVLAQQVVMAELDLHPGPGRAWWSDAWDGYAADRDRILRFLWIASRPTRSCSPATSMASSSTTCSSPGAAPTPRWWRPSWSGPRSAPGPARAVASGSTCVTTPTSASSRAGSAATPAARSSATADTPTCGSSTRSSGRARRSAPWPATWWNPADPARNRSRMESVDNNTLGCLGSTVTDRSRGSEPEFAGLRTKPRKTKAPSLTTRSLPKVS